MFIDDDVFIQIFMYGFSFGFMWFLFSYIVVFFPEAISELKTEIKKYKEHKKEIAGD